MHAPTESLLVRLCAVLEAGLGASSRTLAEYVVALHARHGTHDAFAEALAQASGTALDASLTRALYDTIEEFNSAQKRTANDSTDINGKTTSDSQNVKRPAIVDVSKEPAKEAQGSAQLSTEPKQKRRQVSATERFELRQLAASGAISATEHAALLGDDCSDDEDAEIVVDVQRPAFLAEACAAAPREAAALTLKPEGSLQRAVSQTMERRGLWNAHETQDDAFPDQQGVMVRNVAYDSGSNAFQKASQDNLQSKIGRQYSSHARETKASKSMQSDASHASAHSHNSEFSGRSNYSPHAGDTRPNETYTAGREADTNDARARRATGHTGFDEERRRLPIYAMREEILNAVHTHDAVVLVGETGSGKTTQVPQYLREAGYCARGRVAVTQPRRVAATSVAARVAAEVGCRLGAAVGYAVRFEDRTGTGTEIKFATDGVLLREAVADAAFSAYSVVMVDEAHERTLNTDLLLGLLKQAVVLRRDHPAGRLRVIVASATLDAERYASFLGSGTPVLSVPGRTFPVRVLYAEQPEADYVEAAVLGALQVHEDAPLPGDVLVFLAGQEEIEAACAAISRGAQRRRMRPVAVHPLYASLAPEAQARVFERPPAGTRRIVVATNVAETSLTLDGIVHVVDAGVAKVRVCDARRRLERLIVAPVSQAQARQRAGRAGRTAPGTAYRLYTEEAYLREMRPAAVPEIQRTSLAAAVLALASLGVRDFEAFPLLDAPPPGALAAAAEELCALGALDAATGALTELGRRMAALPVEPQLGRMLLHAHARGVGPEALGIAAMLSAGNAYVRPRDRAAQADRARAALEHADGDQLSLLVVYDAYVRSGFSAQWCAAHYVHARTLRRAHDIRGQLAGLLGRAAGAGDLGHRPFDREDAALSAAIREAVAAGFFMQAARRVPGLDAHGAQYVPLLASGRPEDECAQLHPSCALVHRPPGTIVYHELVATSRAYVRTACAIDARWLPRLAPAFFRAATEAEVAQRANAVPIVSLRPRAVRPRV